MDPSSKAGEFDVVIVGGGPVGLLMAYQLQRFGVTACVVEQYEKEAQDGYGRAIALFPRTSEQLDQLDLIDPMLQLGFACRTSVTYKNGERVIPGRVWTFMENIRDTAYDFTLVLRQMYTEEIFRQKLNEVGASYYQATECVDFAVDETATPDGYAVTSTFTDRKTQKTFKLKSKYLVGADGGKSFVRRHAGIPFEGDTSEDKWIRIDGLVETDMPLNRSYGAIESKTHGNVLWAPLDHGATRIGYAYTPEIAKKYPGGVTEEVAIKEALEGMKPFKVEFKEVHWWTLYTIGQRMAKTFAIKDCIFLCGDAAHTHSSGAAQGLNTGIHDAVNLGWKLALTIRGITKPSVLKTYSTERTTAVEKLINYDKDISLLMTHKWPAWYKGDPEADPYLVLGDIFEKAASFNTGLGISYPDNVLNQAAMVPVAAAPGSRPPDVDLTTPGTNRATRLQRITLNTGTFWTIVFTGTINSTSPLLKTLAGFLEGEGKPLRSHIANSWVTISPSVGCSPYEALGMKPFGNMYYDNTGDAHEKFGIAMDKGAVVVLRPDGLVATAGPIEGSWLKEYFSTVLV
ncbi:FAD binding domain-containing protein [Stachybotrys elegans]|uniref:FAD binding domain-containing protein n=1 Tax=Stachybotrys elegans TaxID=80388 RepID=A0A8K0T3X8_9HYPO|nr:FAD binding domain-containing protein [Stachybotrys elegans]